MKRIKFNSFAILLLLVLMIIPFGNVSGGIIGEEVIPDGDTVILDHFDGSTVGTKPSNATLLTYVPSVPGLNQAGDFIQSTYLIYDVNPWSATLSSQGTIEFWIYPHEGNIRYLFNNWNFSESDLSSGGNVIQIRRDPATDQVGYVNWNGTPAGGWLTSNSTLPLNQWSHFAASWGPDGTKIYINGVLDISVPDNRYPTSPRWFYLKCWLQPDLGHIDEFHVSQVQRSDAEIASRVRYVPDLSSPGFEPPMANGPVTVKKNRALPLKIQLYNMDGSLISDMDIEASPVLQVFFTPETGGTPMDVTGEAFPVGQGTDGNQFVYVGGKWQFNLNTKNYSASGTYIITIESGDRLEYGLVSPPTATFVVE